MSVALERVVGQQRVDQVTVQQALNMRFFNHLRQVTFRSPQILGLGAHVVKMRGREIARPRYDRHFGPLSRLAQMARNSEEL
ncbi:MAG: hypothetical protein HY246_02380 [Proteobacteria bacterium]|nr:hypothetical protein [Pseudomonadota bacterium]